MVGILIASTKSHINNYLLVLLIMNEIFTSIFLVVHQAPKVGGMAVEGQQMRVDLTSYNLWPRGIMFSLSWFSFLKYCGIHSFRGNVFLNVIQER